MNEAYDSKTVIPMPRKSQPPAPPPQLTAPPIARGVPLDVYMNQISPGSAGKSIGQLRREAVEKSGVIQGAS